MGVLWYPPSIDWEVTPYCNHKCIHCYNYWRTDEDKNSDLQFNKIVDYEYYLKIAYRIVESKPVSVVITGGEPLSVFEKLKPSIEFLLKNDIYVSINTNITLLTQEMIEFFKKNNIGLFISFPCSNEKICDYITGKKDSLKNISNNILKLTTFEIPIAVNMVVSKLNYHYIEETAKYVKEKLGITHFCATKVSLPIHARPELKKYLLSKEEFNNMLQTLIYIRDKYNINVDSAWAYSLCGLEGDTIINQFAYKRQCGAGKFNFSVTYNGDIKACAVDEKIYGNILNEKFSDVINKMKNWQNNTFIPNECVDCKSFNICGGGCRLDAQNTYNDIYALDSSANIANKTFDYKIPDPKLLDKKEMYSLSPNTKFVKENNCIRVNSGRNFIFIINEFYEFLIHNKDFNLDMLIDKFNLSYKLANTFMYQLIKNNIISLK